MKNNKPSLSVFFHPHVFWSLKVSGVGRYMVELGEAFTKMGVELHCPIKNTPTELLKNASFFEDCSRETPILPAYIRAALFLAKKLKLKLKFTRIERYLEGKRALQQGKFHVIHPTHNNSIEILKHLKNSALVITVHDMIHEIYPNIFSKNDVSIIRKKKMVLAADRIIAISECTKRDLVRITGVNPNKVDVIYHGNSLSLPDDAATRVLDIPKHYLLFVGHRFSYKNFTRFIKAAARLMQENPELHVFCAGGTQFTKSELNLINTLKIADRITQSWVSDDTLGILYNRCIAFIYPSEYEGFGLPILEAFNCRAPVLCAKASCFPEVAGDACIYFEPKDEESIYQAISKVYQSDECRNELINLGTERLKLFSWEKCAKETLECYQRAMKQ